MESKYLDMKTGYEWNRKDIEDKILFAKEMAQDWDIYHKIISECYYNNIYKEYTGDLKHDGNGAWGTVASWYKLLEKDPRDANYLHGLSKAIYRLVQYLRAAETLILLMELKGVIKNERQ